jgi:hypothetical protein
MIGYEKQMKKMFREVSSGLTHRFALDALFRFEDLLILNLSACRAQCASRRRALCIPYCTKKR